MKPPTPPQQSPFLPGLYYHVYNRGNNGENLFRQERNYHYFLKLYALHIYIIAETFAYCLLPNHFHWLIRIRERPLLDLAGLPNLPGLKDFEGWPKPPHQYFSNFFNAYTKAVNKVYQRTGSLFEKPVHRKLVTTDAYFTALIAYIHRNPQKHGLVADFRDWPYSSYHTLLSEKPSRLERKTVIDWFGDTDVFRTFHQREVAEKALSPFLFDE